ncbi:MAG: TolC family protein [Planctomycetota bacterium]
MAEDIIQKKTEEAFGQVRQFSIERPSNILRRRLLIEQNLPYSGEASLGTDKLKPIGAGLERDKTQEQRSFDPTLLLEANKTLQPTLQLSLMQALQIGARNSFDYQNRKEDIFQTALSLDLERNNFRNIFTGQVTSLIESDTTGDRAVSGTENSGSMSLKRQLESGAAFSTALAVDLANLLTANRASSLGIKGDASISIPLLRGSGRDIVTEPLTQAEREVLYAIYEFERFKRSFAVNIASQYLDVMKQLDQVKNQEENYRSLIASARRSRRLADAGRLPEIQVDQAVQNELRARDRWITANESYKNRADSFKSLLGLPPDARIELDRSDLERLVAPTTEIMADIIRKEESQEDKETPPADAPIELLMPDRENAGPMEIDETLAIGLGLENRLDLRVATGRVYDAQRKVMVAADALDAELTLLGSAGLGANRKIRDAASDDAQLRTNKGIYSALLTLDLPFERTAERNAYRNSIIKLERSVRDVQMLEDKIKLAIRNELRDLFATRESLQIQAKAVLVAEKRVKSVNLFLEAGRAEIRDLLEAQDSLLSAQNSLTAAVVSYRVAELELQRDIGLLKIDEKGLWEEYSPEKIANGKD